LAPLSADIRAETFAVDASDPGAHGAWRQVEAAMAARDVAVGEPWTFPEHRTMAEVIADEATAA